MIQMWAQAAALVCARLRHVARVSNALSVWGRKKVVRISRVKADDDDDASLRRVRSRVPPLSLSLVVFEKR